MKNSNDPIGNRTSDFRLLAHCFSLEYTACNAYAPYCILISGLSASSTIFFDIISQMAWFLAKSYWTQNVFWFSLQLLSKTFLVLWEIQRDTVINVKTPSRKVLILVWFEWNFIFLDRFSRKKTLKHQIYSKFAQWESSCSMRKDGQEEANTRFLQFCEGA